jgi:HEAT repeats
MKSMMRLQFVLSALLMALPLIVSGQKRFSSSLPAAARAEIVALESAAGFDPVRGTFHAPYDETMLRNLVSTLVNGSHPAVRHRAAELIADVLGRFDVPAAAVQKIVQPALRANLERREGLRESEDGTQLDETIERAETLRQTQVRTRLVGAIERAAWQAEYRLLTAEADRLRFLAGAVYVVRGQDSYYYNFGAIDHLVGIGGEKARNVIEAKLAESRQRSVPSDITHQLSAALIKLGVETAEPNARTSRLLALVSNAKDPVSRNVTWWAVRELGRMEHPAAADALRTIWNDDTLDEMVRYEAQESLVARGQVPVIERTIAFQ